MVGFGFLGLGFEVVWVGGDWICFGCAAGGVNRYPLIWSVVGVQGILVWFAFRAVWNFGISCGFAIFVGLV